MKIIKAIISGCLLAVSTSLYAGPVDINSADAKSLAAELSGIGDKKAQAIVEYRNAHGAFASMDDLANVKGISEKTIDKNRENILLGKK
ncbi:MAG: helix-hairpin-helix domain-containing protein [Gammaproteobacteria bacterium]|nr:helix-hairpin-helix domain-containing protein [Gammaproteobacteria bacterium]